MPNGGASRLVERVVLRRVTSRLGFCDVRLPDVHLHGLRIEESDTGALTIRTPWRIDSNGREWKHFDLQPGAREAIEREITQLWARVTTNV
jgi:hypothetical protein